MKQFVKSIPFLSAFAKWLYFHIYVPVFSPFKDSETYWEDRYRRGGDSGAGSYNRLAVFKAQILNEFVKKKAIRTVIEYGCGDGNQLKLCEFPEYLGFDVSASAVSCCLDLFSDDGTKRFKNIAEYENETAQLALSLDVIYHLIEDEIYQSYMNRLFDSSDRYVVIYSTDTDLQEKISVPHVKHRKFTDWVKVHKEDWSLVQVIPNKYPYKGNDKIGSLANFYVYERI